METTLAEWSPTFSRTLVQLAPVFILIVWCLFAIDWRKAWPVLAAGGWAALVLIGLMGAAVWSFVFPESIRVPGLGTVSNGLWQLCASALLIGVVLFCGWVQSRWRYTPEEFNLDEPAHHHHGDHEHHHAHH